MPALKNGAARNEAQRKAAASSGKEEKVGSTVDRIVEEGTPRLERRWDDLLATGAVAGLEVGIGVLALLVVQDATGSTLLAGLAFSFGFLALLLGHSELFTEGFLVPVTVVAAGAARLRDMLRFWVGSAVANLAGGWVITYIAIKAYPDLGPTAIESARHFIDMGITVRSFCLAVLAGSVITLMTRMHNGTDSMGIRVFVSVFAGFLLAGLQLAHSILDSLLIFAALHTGQAPFGYADWLGWVGWAALGNMVGGIGLVSGLRLIRSRDLIAEHRTRS